MRTPLGLIHEKVNEYFGIDHKKDYFQIFQRTRKRSVVYKRQIFHYLSRQMNNNISTTYDYIGSYLSDICGSYDHCTVIHSENKISGYLTYDKTVIEDVGKITKLIEDAKELDDENS